MTCHEALQSVHLDLDDRHLDLWHGELCDRIIRVDSPWSSGQRLDLGLTLSRGAGVVSFEAHIRAAGLVVERGPGRIGRESEPPGLVLSLVTAGAAELTLEAETREIRAGDLFLTDAHHPFRKRMGEGYRETFLYFPLPGDRLARDEHSMYPGIAPRGALSDLLGDTLLSIRRNIGALGSVEWRPVVEAVHGLALGAFAARREPPVAATRVAFRARVTRYLDAHLGDPDLSPSRIASDLHVSLRYLHRLFEETGASVGATLLARRLERCRARLLDPAEATRSISEIALDCGFNSASHFSRTFRARFGESAQDMRRRPLPGGAPGQARSAGEPG